MEANCSHDAWEWPMERCPGCGAAGPGPLPGQPVTYHGGISLGVPIEVQVDPSKFVGTMSLEPRPDPELPPIPEPGFYWARIDDNPGQWTVVEVDVAGALRPAGIRTIHSPSEWMPFVLEWGPKLEPPLAPPAVPRGAPPLLHSLARSVEDIDREIAQLAVKRARIEAELREKLESLR